MILNSLLYFMIGYLIVTGIASLHFLVNWKIRGQEGFDATLGIKALKVNATQLEAFKTTKPFHPIYNILIFPFISVWMMKNFPSMPSFMTAIGISVLWIVYSLVLDSLCWVILPHPWRLTAKELFITDQPGITLAYGAIFISPIAAFMYLLL